LFFLVKWLIVVFLVLFPSRGLGTREGLGLENRGWRTRFLSTRSHCPGIRILVPKPQLGNRTNTTINLLTRKNKTYYEKQI